NVMIDRRLHEAVILPYKEYGLVYWNKPINVGYNKKLYYTRRYDDVVEIDEIDSPNSENPIVNIGKIKLKLPDYIIDNEDDKGSDWEPNFQNHFPLYPPSYSITTKPHDTSICEGSKLQLTASSNEDMHDEVYYWIFPNGDTLQGNNFEVSNMKLAYHGTVKVNIRSEFYNMNILDSFNLTVF